MLILSLRWPLFLVLEKNLSVVPSIKEKMTVKKKDNTGFPFKVNENVLKLVVMVTEFVGIQLSPVVCGGGGVRSKSPRGCLKPWMVLNPMHTVFFPIHVYLW